tara:strand:+ start:264 stop:560 length:297 start_codon:yes stop_codon:yes gene_type:complete
MKKTFLIISLIVFSFCSSQDIASDSQRNWCYGAIVESTLDPQLKLKYIDAHMLYGNESESKEIPNTASEIYEFRTNLEQNNEESLRICKIWADMSGID